MKELKFGNITYQFDPNATFKDHTFISFKRITQFKENQKFQNLTVKNENWPAFRQWLLDILCEE